MKNAVTFDSSLSTFIRTLSVDLPASILEDGWLLRDASGHLTFIVASPLSAEIASKIGKRVKLSMMNYCRENCIFDVDHPGVRRIIESAKWSYEYVRRSDKKNEKLTFKIRFIDRRIVGHDWLTQPVAGWQTPEPARIVFASLKGGVGRSTGLAVVAADLAQKGHKVLAIDLDLEAPGIGTMLLRSVDQPKFGVLDWYVERGINGNDADMSLFLLDMIAPSPFSPSNGVIDVVPAVGRISDENPNNVLAKIARAYLESPQEDGPELGFLEKTQELIRQLSALNSYDVILIDARAGLNESTAAALLGLGADVMLFGIDTPQTFASYRYLLSHLARFDRNDDDDWLYRFRMIHAKASRDNEQQMAFRDRAYDIFKEFLYRDLPLLDVNGKLLVTSDGKPLSPKKEFGLTEPVAPHFAWSVLSDGNFAEFDPCNKDFQMKPEFYRETYAGLIDGIDGLLNNLGEKT